MMSSEFHCIVSQEGEASARKSLSSSEDCSTESGRSKNSSLLSEQVVMSSPVLPIDQLIESDQMRESLTQIFNETKMAEQKQTEVLPQEGRALSPESLPPFGGCSTDSEGSKLLPSSSSLIVEEMEENEIPQIVNDPALILEYEKMVEEKKEQMQLAKVKRPKYKPDKKMPKQYKKPKARPTKNLCTITPAQKKRWTDLGIIKSSPDYLSKVWFHRPSNWKATYKEKVDVQRWEVWAEKFNVTQRDMLFLHMGAIYQLEEGTLVPFVKYNKRRFTRKFDSNASSYDDLYKKRFAATKKENEYLVDGNSIGVLPTLECLLDLWAVAIRYTDNWKDAYDVMFKYICDVDAGIPTIKPKYAGFHPGGMGMFYAGVYARGLSSAKFHGPKLARKSFADPISKAALLFDWTAKPSVSDFNKIAKLPEFKAYVRELCWHCSCMDTLMGIWKYPRPHDQDKWRCDSLVAFTYEWVIKPQLPQPTAGEECPNCANPFCANRDADGACSDDDSFFERAQQTLADFKNRVKAGVRGVVSDVIPTQFASLIASLHGQLKELSSVARSLMVKIMGVLKPIAKFLHLDNVNVTDNVLVALDIVRYYLIYINTQSTVIHSLCIFAILSSLGIVDRVVSAFVSWLDEPPVEIPDEINAEPTFSFGVFSRLREVMAGLCSTDPKTLAVPLSLIALVLFGTTVRKCDFSSMSRSFVDYMKNVHFVGAGIVGFTRIFDAITGAVKFVIEFVGKKFFSVVPEDEQAKVALEELTKRFCDWAAQVDLISEEEMIGKLSSSKIIQERVLKLYDQGLEFCKLKYADELPAPLAREMPRLWKLCRESHNTVIRARSLADFRPTPFHVQLFGEPGIGKSTLLSAIVKDIAFKFYPDTSNVVYAKGNTEQFDGYNGQPIYLQDDMFAVDDYKDVVPLLTMVSNCPVQLYMSHLESKGTYFQSDFMLSTTNTPWPDISGVFKREAIWRRRHILANVTIDPRVKHVSTGKFDLQLFRKYYPDQDASEFPHLKFTLYSPTSRDTLLRETPLPNGIVQPTENLTYGQFKERFFTRYTAAREEEKKFEGDRDARYAEVRRVLGEIDDVYREYRAVSGVTHPLYENNYADGERFVQPAPCDDQPVVMSLDFLDAAESEDEILDRVSDLLKTASDDVAASFYRGATDKLNMMMRSRVSFRGPQGLECLMYALFLSSLVRSVPKLFLQEAYGDLLRDAMSAHTNFVAWLRGQDVSIPLSPTELENHKIDGRLIDVLSNLFFSGMERAVESDFDQGHAYNFVGLQELSAIYSVPLLLKRQHVDILKNLSGLLDLPVYTSGVDIEIDDQVPSDWGVEEIDAEITQLEAALTTHLLNLETQVHANSLHPAAMWLEPRMGLLSSANGTTVYRQFVLFENQMRIQGAGGRSDIGLARFFEPFAAIVRCSGRLAALRPARITAAQRQRRGVDSSESVNIDDYEEEYFTSGANWMNDFGYELRFGQRFGIRCIVGHVPFNRIQHQPASPEVIHLANRLGSSLPNFRVSRNDWISIFGNQPYTDGDTGISINFVHHLKRYARLSSSGGYALSRWYWHSDRLEFIADRINSRAYGPVRLAMNGTCLESLSGNWQQDYGRFLAMNDDQRIALYACYQRHSILVNSLLSYGRGAAGRAKSLFDTIWGAITGSISYLWSKLCHFKLPLSVGILAMCIIGGCTAFSRLFLPKETSFRPSSIFSNRGRTDYLPRATSGDIATKAVAGVTRCNIAGACFMGYRVYNHCLLVPWHAVSRYKATKESFMITILISRGVLYTFQMLPQFVHYFPGSDLALLYNDNFPAWGDRLRYIKTDAEQEVEKDTAATIITRDISGEIVTGQCPYNGSLGEQVTTFNSYTSILHTRVGVLEYALEVGVSGAPIFLRNSGLTNATIAGFQSYRQRGHSYFTIVPREMIMAKCMEFTSAMPTPPGPFALASEDAATPTAGLIDEHLNYEGTVPARYIAAQPPKSEFTKTILYDRFDVTRVPAILSEYSPYFDRAQGHPARYSINKHGRGTLCELPRELLRQAVREYAEYYRFKIKKPHVLSITEAIEGVGDMRHIDLNTSPGLPWVLVRTQKGKKDFIRIDELGKLTYLNPDLHSSVANFEEGFRNGVIPFFSMMEIMKDELRPIAKAYGLKEEDVPKYFGKVPPKEWPTPRLCKTRTITVMPMEFTILYRRLFGSFFSQLYHLANTGLEPYCVGINPDGTASANMYFACTKLNDVGFDLDVSNWDGHYSWQLFSAVCDLVNAVYDDDHARTRTSLCYAACFGHVQFRDIVYKKNYGMPSGFPGTADFNTIGHMLVDYVFWLMINREAGRYSECTLEVYLNRTVSRFYGDDRLTVVHPYSASIFHSGSVSALYEQFGWPTTTAAKTSAGGMVPISELQFLKRKWLVDVEDPVYVRWAMDRRTIETLAQYIRKTFEPRSQFQLNLRTALDFACDWGESYFNWIRDQINDGLVKQRRRPLIADYLTYRSIKRARYFGVDGVVPPKDESLDWSEITETPDGGLPIIE